MKSVSGDGHNLTVHWETFGRLQNIVFEQDCHLCQSPAVMLVHKKFEKLDNLCNSNDLKASSERCDFFFILTVYKQRLRLPSELLAYSYTSQPTSKSPQVWMLKVNNSKVFYRFLGTYWPRGMFKMLSNLLCEVSLHNDLHPFTQFSTDSDLFSFYSLSFHVCRAR